MALTKVNAEGINVADDFAFTGTVSGAADPADFVKIHQVVVTDAVAYIEFTSTYITDAYDSYYVIHKGLTFASDNPKLRMNLSIDNGSNLITSGVTGAAYHQLMNTASSGHTPNSKAYHPFSEAEDTVGYATGHCWYHNLRDTTANFKYTMGDSVNHHSGAYEVSYQSACLHTTASAINNIRYFGGSNFNGGTFTLYGIVGAN